MDIEELMIKCKWYKEIHTFGNNKCIIYHKDGDEISEENIKEILDNQN